MYVKNQNDYVWPGLIQPKKDELLSSFLVRLAYTHSTKVHTFYKLIWPHLHIWNRDIDINPKDEIIQCLSIRTASHIDTIKETTLDAYESYLYFNHNNSINKQWILPSGVYHRLKTRHCNQFCPKCLLKDKTSPYFRRKWRLSLFVCCPYCELKLHDACPNCGNPVNFSRQDFGDKKAIPDRKLSLCTFCDFDLSKSQQIPVDSKLLKNQIYAQNLLDIGFNEDFQYGPLYFDVLYQLVKILNSSKFEGFQKKLHQKIGIPFFKRNGGFENHFNFLRIDKRITILSLAYKLLEDWPSSFLELCLEAKLSSYVLFYEMSYIPYWYWNVVKPNFYNKRY